jgi:hypothetical protein
MTDKRMYFICAKCKNFHVIELDYVDELLSQGHDHEPCPKCEHKNYFKDGKIDDIQNIDKLYEQAFRERVKIRWKWNYMHVSTGRGRNKN